MSQSLNALRGQVHRFTGIVDRFGGYQADQGQIHTLCVRDLALADSGQAIDPDHWWFRLREIWTQAGVCAGDRVLFTAKVQRCSKGGTRAQVIGFGAAPRDLVILERPQEESLVCDLQHQVERLRRQLKETELSCQKLSEQQQFLLRQSDNLSQRLLASELSRLSLEQQLREYQGASLTPRQPGRLHTLAAA
jgi:hypothetical protein